MKRILKFLFNLAGTLSLILVLIFIGFFLYFTFTGDVDRLLNEIERGALASRGYTLEDLPDGDFKIIGKPPAADRLALSAQSVTHFIRPERIALFRMENGKIDAVLDNGNRVEGIRTSISSLHNVLQEYGHDSFFKTRDYLINYHFVSQYYPENMAAPAGSNYVYRAILETGDTLIIPNNRNREFLEAMESHAISIN